DVEGLVTLGGRVAVDVDGDGLGGHRGRGGQDGGGALVVLPGGRRAAPRGVVDTDGLITGVGQGDDEDGLGGAAVPLADLRVADRDARQIVVVGDGADPLPVPDGGARGAAQVDQEGLVVLVGGVAVNDHGDGLGGH